jgi:hypothetical protein
LPRAEFTIFGECLRPPGFQGAEINPDRSYNGCTLFTFFTRDGKLISEYKT